MTIYSGPTGPGQFVQTNPRYQLPPVGGVPPSTGSAGFSFENLLNQMRGFGANVGAKATQAGRAVANASATPTGQRIAGLAAPVAYGVGSVMSGDVAQGVGEIGGGIAGAGLAGGLAQAAQTALPGARGKLAAAAIRGVGGLVGGGIGGGLASSAANAAGNIGSALTGRTREAGQTPGAVPGTTAPGVGDYSDKNMADLERLLRATGQNQVGIAQQMLPITNQFRDSEMQRQMQLNQQVGQLTGALNRQSYIAQLAGGAQGEAGATVRTMMTAANPYAASAFQYRG